MSRHAYRENITPPSIDAKPVLIRAAVDESGCLRDRGLRLAAAALGWRHR